MQADFVILPTLTVTLPSTIDGTTGWADLRPRAAMVPGASTVGRSQDERPLGCSVSVSDTELGPWSQQTWRPASVGLSLVLRARSRGFFPYFGFLIREVGRMTIDSDPMDYYLGVWARCVAPLCLHFLDKW